jgi:hypothetical protein
MADIDPLKILNSETQVGPDGIARRANEKVTRSYMQFGKYLFLHHTFFRSKKLPPSTPLFFIFLKTIKIRFPLKFGDKFKQIYKNVYPR